MTRTEWELRMVRRQLQRADEEQRRSLKERERILKEARDIEALIALHKRARKDE
jgi:hypothetical protein